MGVAAVAVLVPVPAHACSCGGWEVEKALAAERAVAVVTRTDEGAGRASDGTTPPATLTVEASTPDLPAEVSADTTGEECQPYIPVGAVTAVTFERKQPGVSDPPGDWILGGCSRMELGPVFRQTLGAPVAERGGALVAVVAGRFGGARLAALDAAGIVVAYDGLDGATAGPPALCPGGTALAAIGHSIGPDEQYGPPQLTVHDTSTLRTRRTVALPQRPYGRIIALRCADPHGKRVEVLADEQDGSDRRHPARLSTITETEKAAVQLGVLDVGVATSDGFVAVAGPEGHLSLLRIRPQGETQKIAALPELLSVEQLQLSPDQATVAMVGSRLDYSEVLRTVDLATGATLAEQAPPGGHVSAMAWTGPDRLVVKPDSRDRSATQRVLDRRLREVATLPAAPGWEIAAVGDTLVGFGEARMTLTPQTGRARVLAPLRLAAATGAVALPGRAFTTDPAALFPAAVAHLPDSRLTPALGDTDTVALTSRRARGRWSAFEFVSPLRFFAGSYAVRAGWS